MDSNEDLDLIEPIAVVGYSLKFPQDATSSKGFWKMLVQRENAMTDFPADRVNISAFYHPTKHDALPVRGAHFLKEDLGAFDAEFFSIPPDEAAALDPAQRILLETTFRAFENAGIRLEDLPGSRTSVHTGCFTNDYLLQLLRDPARLPPHTANAASLSMLANRVSWFFGLAGPSVNLDSACSSGALAVDQSCQLLRSGTTSMGVVAGCNLIFDPDFTNALAKMSMLSPDSRSFAFDYKANGYARGEGIGVVILKLLSNAVRDNDTIRAVIRASGSNQDGHTPGITHPNSRAQSQLMFDTYRKAGLSMKHTYFFEAHGTGTAIGDPIEAEAIAEVFAPHCSRKDPLYIGAVKSNIGHLEGGSGVAGLLKAIMVLETGVIVPNTNFEKINPRINAEKANMVFPTSCVPWPVPGIRRASINSFGYGGTNAHLIVDDAYSYLSRNDLKGNHRTWNGIPNDLSQLACAFADVDHARIGNIRPFESFSNATLTRPKLFVWSACDRGSLNKLVAQCQEYCLQYTEKHSKNPFFVHDLAYTLDSRRSSLPWKSWATINSAVDLGALTSIATEPIRSQLKPPRLAFVFTGQGSQWYAMGRELLEYPAFSHVIHEGTRFLTELGCSWSVEEELLKTESESNIDMAEFSQPLVAIVQIALVDLLKKFSVRPAVVIGHSMGEIAAAYCAGALSLGSAFKLAYYRGKFASRIAACDSKKGAMLAVGTSVDKIGPYLAAIRSRYPYSDVMISCFNSPVSLTISGEESQIEQLKRDLDSDDVFTRRVKVDVAYHSPQMQQIVGDCMKAFGTLPLQDCSPSVKFISSVTGSFTSKKELCDAAYWVQNIVSPVLFMQAVQHLRPQAEDSTAIVDQIVEIGPHAALKGPIRETLATFDGGKDFDYGSALRRRKSAMTTLMELLGHLYSCGYPVDVREINDPIANEPNSRICLVDLPEYPFNHTISYWHESFLSKDYRLRPYGHVELLGTRGRDWNPLDAKWRCIVRPSEFPWIEDHVMSGTIMYPASAMIAMAIEATLQMVDPKHLLVGFTLRRLRFTSPVIVSLDDDDTETRFHLKPTQLASARDNPRFEFTLFSVRQGHWSENCNGTIQVHYKKPEDEEVTSGRTFHYSKAWTSDLANCSHQVDPVELYQFLTREGFQYGPSFQGIASARHDGFNKAIGHIDLSKPLEAGAATHPFTIHPASLDAIVQLVLVALSSGGNRDVPTQIPTAIEKMWIAADGLELVTDRRLQKEILVSAHADCSRSKTPVGSAFVLSSDRQNVRLVMDGLVTSVISSPQSIQPVKSSSKQFWYRIQNGIDLDLLAPKKIIEWLTRVCGLDMAGPASFFQDLRLELVAVMRTLQREAQAMNLTREPSHLRKYLDWLDEELQKQTGNDYETLDSSQVARVRDKDSMGKLFPNIVERALDILKGKADGRQSLFDDNPGGDSLAQQAPESPYLLKVERYVAGLAFKNPKMNILELSAGTEVFTKHILHGLASLDNRKDHRYNQYFYANLTSVSTGGENDRFGTRQQNITSVVLDANEDISKQGLKERHFDLIAVSDVFHVFGNLELAVQAIRKLLRPHGKLILHGNVRPERPETTFVYGLLSERWFDQENGASPLANETTWHDLLVANGFSGADFVLRDFCDEVCHTKSVICSTAIESYSKDLLPETDLALLVDYDSSSQVELARELEMHLFMKYELRPRMINWHRPSDIDSRVEILINLVDLGNPVLPNLTEELFSSLRRLISSAEKVLWMTDGGGRAADPGFGMVDGFIRTLSIERIELQILSVALENFPSAEIDHAQAILRSLDQLHHKSKQADLENYRVIDGALHVDRICEDAAVKTAMMEALSGEKEVMQPLEQSRPFSINMENRTQPHVFHFFEDAASADAVRSDEIEVEVQAIGLNSVDTDLLTGKPPNSRSAFGSECAGTVVAVGAFSSFNLGDHVCLYGSKISRSTVRSKTQLVARIPRNMTFAEASTLPQDHLLASYLLRCLIRPVDNDTVLINSGHHSVARALLNLSFGVWKSVYVVAWTKEYAAALRQSYGKRVTVLLRTDLVEQIRRIEKGGVQVVINFSPEEDLLSLMDCTATFGQIVYVSDTEKVPSKAQSIPSLRSNISLKTVEMGEELRAQLASHHVPLRTIVDESLKFYDQAIFPMHTYDASQLEAGFAQLKELGNWGKVAITLDAKISLPVTKKLRLTYFFDPTSSYLVAGGFGDLGRCLATWMTTRGARNLILLSRSGPRTTVAQDMLKQLEKDGVRVFATACDVGSRRSLEDTLRECETTMPPIKGCIQASGVLKDIMYKDMTFEDWTSSINCKVSGSWNLHELLPKGLDFFILTSSINGILGQATQANYASGNTYLDALARYRIAKGEKAISMDLGVLPTGGLVSQTSNLLARLTNTGFYAPITESELLALFDYYCDPALELSDPAQAQVVVGITSPAELQAQGRDLHQSMRQPFWSLTLPQAGQQPKVSQMEKEKVSVISELQKSDSLDEAATLIARVLTERLARMVAVPEEQIKMDQSMAANGLDSLSAVEARNWIVKMFGVQLSLFEILDDAPIQATGELIAKKWWEKQQA
ncbi:MAG: Type I Iterative PKS [Bathelium mastoideum]|nr:MAG: Type I Iterative PKS [Bathelium mastoideum]